MTAGTGQGTPTTGLRAGIGGAICDPIYPRVVYGPGGVLLLRPPSPAQPARPCPAQPSLAQPWQPGEKLLIPLLILADSVGTRYVNIYTVSLKYRP